jgi:hypothetical protein
MSRSGTRARSPRHDHTVENYGQAQAWLQRWAFNDPQQIRVPVRVCSTTNLGQLFRQDALVDQPWTRIRLRADEVLP